MDNHKSPFRNIMTSIHTLSCWKYICWVHYLFIVATLFSCDPAKVIQINNNSSKDLLVQANRTSCPVISSRVVVNSNLNNELIVPPGNSEIIHLGIGWWQEEEVKQVHSCLNSFLFMKTGDTINQNIFRIKMRRGGFAKRIMKIDISNDKP